MSDGGSTADQMLDLNKWHPGDAHVHSIYSALDIGQIARWAKHQHPITGRLLIKALKRWFKAKDEDGSEDENRVYNIEGTGRCCDFPPLMESRQLHWAVLTDHGPNMGFPAIQKEDIKKVFLRRRYRRDFQERAADDLIDNHPADLLGYSTDIACKRWQRRQGELDELGQECCLLGGEELSDLWRYGHMLVYASPSYIYDDPNPDMVIYELLEHLSFHEESVLNRINEKKRACQREYLNGLKGAYRKYDQRVFGYIAHPLSRGHSWEGFEQELQYIDKRPYIKGFELFNDKSPQPEDKLLRIWHDNLKAGRMIFIIGGTDCHNEDDWKRCKTKTYAFVPRAGCNLCGGDREDLMAALREGRTVVSRGPLVVFTARNGAEGNEAGIGSELSVKRGDTVRIEWKASAGEQESIYPTMTYFAGCGDGEHDVPVADFKVPDEFAGIGYVRLKGSNAEGDCYTNPIFLVKR